jgi:hypothetical protein
LNFSASATSSSLAVVRDQRDHAVHSAGVRDSRAAGGDAPVTIR